MKRFIVFFAVMALIIAMLGCAVNATTGSIVVKNKSDKDASNVKVGNTTIGFVGKGQTTTVYFYTTENSAKVTADGFACYSSVKSGSINLKFNYIYDLELYKQGTATGNNISGYVYYISGVNTSGSNTTADNESMN